MSMPTLAQIAAAVSAYQPSRDERHQLALMQAQVALDALQAGDVSAASLFLVDAIGHMKAMRDAPGRCAREEGNG